MSHILAQSRAKEHSATHLAAVDKDTMRLSKLTSVARQITKSNPTIILRIETFPDLTVFITTQSRIQVYIAMVSVGRDHFMGMTFDGSGMVTDGFIDPTFNILFCRL